MRYDHNNKARLPYHYVCGFNEEKKQWEEQNTEKLKEDQKSYNKYRSPTQLPFSELLKEEYPTRVCETCDAVYLDGETDTKGNYHTCCYALRNNMNERTGRHNIIRHPDQNIQQCDLLRKLFKPDPNNAHQVERHLDSVFIDTIFLALSMYIFVNISHM